MGYGMNLSSKINGSLVIMSPTCQTFLHIQMSTLHPSLVTLWTCVLINVALWPFLWGGMKSWGENCWTIPIIEFTSKNAWSHDVGLTKCLNSFYSDFINQWWNTNLKNSFALVPDSLHISHAMLSVVNAWIEVLFFRRRHFP